MLKHDYPGRWSVPCVLIAQILGLMLLATAGTAVGSPSSSYQLGAGDLIQIQVYGEDDLSIKARVESDGNLSYPLLGTIRVEGKSTAQLQQAITRGLQDGYLDDPDVRVFILEYRPVYVSGAVRKPGSYPYAPGLTVRKAVTLAGGFSDLASKSDIYVIGSDAPTGRGRRSVELDTSVGAGDTIIVEEGFF